MADDFLVMPTSTCPACTRAINAVSQADQPHTQIPEPGDITICYYCVTPLIFTDAMQLRLLTGAELQEHEQTILEGTDALLQVKMSLGIVPFDFGTQELL